MAQLPPIRSPARVWLRELRFGVLPRLVFGAALAAVMVLWHNQVGAPYRPNTQAVPARAGTPRTSHPEGVGQTEPQECISLLPVLAEMKVHER